MTHPIDLGIRSEANGRQVTGDCITCARPPKQGEKYGTGTNDWDYLGMCPDCWNSYLGEEEED